MKENKKLEKELNRQYQVKETTAVNMLTTNGSSNLTCTNSTSLPSLILPLNLPSSVSQSASLAVSSTTSSNIQSMLFNSSTSLESSSLDSTITSTASRNSTDSSDASLEIPDPSLHPQDSTESSLPAETPTCYIQEQLGHHYRFTVEKLDESMNQMSEKIIS